MRLLATLCSTIGCLMLLTTAARSDESADAKLEAFFKAHLERQFQARPLDATFLGDHRFDYLLDDLSPKARESWLQQTRTTLDKLPTEINYADLSRDGQINYEILRSELVRTIWLAENT